MPTGEELKEKVDALIDARAKDLAYQDVINLLEKYDKKILRQINELDRKYEKMEKSGIKNNNYYNTSYHLTILRHQILHIKDFRIEILKRSLEISKALKAAELEYKELVKQNDEQQ